MFSAVIVLKSTKSMYYHTMKDDEGLMLSVTGMLDRAS